MKRFITVMLLLSFNIHASQCDSHRVQLQVLGSGGPELDDGRHSSSYLIWLDGKARVMVDAGPGSSYMFGESQARFEDLDAVLLTHLHVDHVGDLPAYIKGSYFTDRKKDLKAFGPDKGWKMPSTSEYFNRLMGEQGAYAYLDDYLRQDLPGDYNVIVTDVPLTRRETHLFDLGNAISAKATPVHHGPVPAIAWRVELAGCVVGFSGDMSNQFEVFADFAKGADILVMHNAIPSSASSVAKHLHMTPSQIGDIAEKAQAKALVLSHFMNRTRDRETTREQVSAHYKGQLHFADDGVVFAMK